MTPEKQKKLEAKGWVFSSPEEFLGLSEHEAMAVEVKLALDKVSDRDSSKEDSSVQTGQFVTALEA